MDSNAYKSAQEHSLTNISVNRLCTNGQEVVSVPLTSLFFCCVIQQDPFMSVVSEKRIYIQHDIHPNKTSFREFVEEKCQSVSNH